MAYRTEHEQDIKRLITMLTDACRQDKLGMAESPEHLPPRVDISGFKDICTDLLDKTHSSRREYGRLLMFDPESRGLVFSNVTAGSQDAVQYRERVRFIQPENLMSLSTDERQAVMVAQQQMRSSKNLRLLGDGSDLGRRLRSSIVHPVAEIHTHPADTPISPIDIAVTLYNPTMRMQIVIEPSGRRSAIMTTARTQWVPPERRDEVRTNWTNMVARRIEQALSAQRDEGISDEQLNWMVQDTFARNAGAQFGFGYYVETKQDTLERMEWPPS